MLSTLLNASIAVLVQVLVPQVQSKLNNFYLIKKVSQTARFFLFLFFAKSTFYPFPRFIKTTEESTISMPRSFIGVTDS